MDMRDFWIAHYLSRSGGGSGGPLQTGLAIIMLVVMIIGGILYGLLWIYELIAGVTQSIPLLSLAIIGVISVIFGWLFGADSSRKVTTKILAPTAVCLGTVGIFSIIMVASGAPTFEQTSELIKATLALLSLIIVASYVFLLYSTVRYQPKEKLGKITRTGSLVFFGWWAWAAFFNLPLEGIPMASTTNFIICGTIGVLAMGIIESGLLDDVPFSNPLAG